MTWGQQLLRLQLGVSVTQDGATPPWRFAISFRDEFQQVTPIVI
jgi:hypothetical protein